MELSQIRSQLQVLTNALLELENERGSMCRSECSSTDPTVELKADPSPKASPLYVPTNWPRVGGRENLPSTAELLGSAAFRDRYRPGEEREIYVAACSGLARLSTLFRLPTYKISTCGAGRLPERIKELRRDGYGAEWRSNGQYVVDDKGFNDWFPSHIYLNFPTAENSPVAIRPRALTVRLPITMSATDFDIAFDREVRKAAIDLWVATPEGAAHCAWLGVDPAIAQRSTAYPHGAGARDCPCTEIAILRIREESDRLVKIAERVILQHVAMPI